MHPEFLWTTVVCALVTVALKSSFIEGARYIRLPSWFRDALEFVPPAVLIALVVPGVFSGQSSLERALGAVAVDPRMVAAATACAIYLVTQRTWPTLVGGMLCLHGAYWLQI
jgi:branched-subunit amino acid transport protein